MKYKLFNELTFSIILIVLSVLFLDPFMFWMPSQLVYILMGIVVAVFAIFAGLIWKERAQDERDELHRMMAGRVGYVFGSGILVLGIVWQTATTHLDPWLVFAFVGMVFGKLLGLYYGKITW